MIVEMLRGYTDLILLKLLQDGPGYGYLLNNRIEEISQGKLKLTEATLYTTFKRLESSGYIVSFLQEGKNKTMRKYYSITSAGEVFLKEQTANFLDVQNTLNLFFKGDK